MEHPQVTALFQRLNYAFRDLSLALLALTHRSFCNEHPELAPEHNERLEFLGDAVLDFIVSELLMERFPALPEGDLSKLRATLVSETALAHLARELELGECLRVGRGELLTGGRERDSILSDALEALFAAIYLDSAPWEGIAAIRRVVRGLFAPRLEDDAHRPGEGDFKTALQELVQSRHKDTVRYEIVQEEGPDHEKQFEAAVFFQQRELGRGFGRSKKQAEQQAARLALHALQHGSDGAGG
jgi:ribonuclease-3